MKFRLTAAALGLASVVSAQTGTATSSNTVAVSATRSISSQLASQSSAAATGQPCAQVSSAFAQQSPGPYLVLASLANACQRSVPFVKQDALRLIDGIIPALNFQSDLGVLKNPPASYPLAGADLLGDMATLRSQVNSGAFTNEIDFERNLTDVLGKPQDGHLNFQLDGMSVFLYQRWIPGLVSVSMDGTSLPSLYVYTDLINYLSSGGSAPSAVTQINGQNASTFLRTLGENVTYGGFQDPDALYNSQMWVRNSGAGNRASYGAFVNTQSYPGDNTTVTFANGTTLSQPNYASFSASSNTFRGLVDGASYYNLYCNATRKALADGENINDFSGARASQSLEEKISHIDRHDKRWQKFEKRQASSSSTRSSTRTRSVVSSATGATQTATQLTGYPSPIALSDDLSLSGYFLDQPGFTDTAVLVAQQMSEEDPASFQSTLTKFMNACRTGNKKRLVIDIQGNPGGTVSLGFEIFKQLFPNVYPYGAGTYRAFEGLNTLGTFYTNFTTQLAAQAPNNLTLLRSNGYYQPWSAEAYTNASGQLYSSWPQLYGPVKAAKENYTNLVRGDFNSTNYNLATGSIVVSGFANNSQVAASPFTADNIIILSDGRCSSTCTIMSHLLKWQGKVKSIAVGGRPSNGAMQAIGGVKGSQVYGYYLLSAFITGGAQTASALGYRDQVQAFTKSPTLGPILNDSSYVIYRGASGGQLPAAATDFTFNLENNIAEGDTSYTPLQFVYEAADCRLWFQPQHIGDIRTLWYTTASQAFGLNGTRQYSLCVQGSTNASSSLSGNATLFNNGNPTNVTNVPKGVTGSSSGSGNNSGASQLAVSSVAAVVGFVALLLAL